MITKIVNGIPCTRICMMDQNGERGIWYPTIGLPRLSGRETYWHATEAPGDAGANDAIRAQVDVDAEIERKQMITKIVNGIPCTRICMMDQNGERGIWYPTVGLPRLSGRETYWHATEAPGDAGANDAIRAQVDAEIPRPVGGFESDDAEDAHRAAQDKRFLEIAGGAQ